MLRKVDGLQKFCNLRNNIFVCILRFLVFYFKSGIQYMSQGGTSILMVLVLIKIIPGKNDYFIGAVSTKKNLTHIFVTRSLSG